MCNPCSGANDRDVRRREKTQKIKIRNSVLPAEGDRRRRGGSQQKYSCWKFPFFKKKPKPDHVQRGPAVTEDETSLTTTQSGPRLFKRGSESSINSQPQ